MALPVSKNSEAYIILERADKVVLDFQLKRNSSTDPDEKMDQSVATLELYRLTTRLIDSDGLFIYEANHGAHSFISPWHKLVNRQREKFAKRSVGNVNLPGNLLDQVQIAYSFPRKISVVTVGKDYGFNMFPTDLFGQINMTKYVSSLRIGGKATEQVEAIKNVVFSDVAVLSFREVYGMGKNHMNEFQEATVFDTSSSRSEKFGFILPKSFTGYREMILKDSWDHGIHRIHFYDVVNQVCAPNGSTELGHIHRLYAGWREKMGLQTELYLR